MARKRPVKNRAKTAENRDAQGRFLPGTAAGPGRPANPYGRKCAALKAAFAEAVSVEDVQAVARKLVELAQFGNMDALKLFLAAVVGPVVFINPDRVDEDELTVKRAAPTELDELLLIAQGNGSNGRIPELPAAEDIEDDEDAPESEPEPDGPDALMSWQEFAESRLEWGEQAACPIDLIYGRYARWSASDGLPLLPETDLLAWLRENGARIVTLPYSEETVVEGVRVIP